MRRLLHGAGQPKLDRAEAEKRGQNRYLDEKSQVLDLASHLPYKVNVLRQRAANLDETLTALAHPTRRAILTQLSAGEARITDLAEPFDVSLKSVSLHIRALEQAGLVRRRKSGREFLISIDTAPLDSAALWFTQTAALWKFRLHRLSSILSSAGAGPEPAARAVTSLRPRKTRK